MHETSADAAHYGRQMTLREADDAQTDDTIALSNDTITATVDDIIDQIPGGQEGSRLDITLDSQDGGGGWIKVGCYNLNRRGGTGTTI